MRTLPRHFDNMSNQAQQLAEKAKRTRQLIVGWLGYCSIPTSKIVQLLVRGKDSNFIYEFACDVHNEADKNTQRWFNRNKQISF